MWPFQVIGMAESILRVTLRPKRYVGFLGKLDTTLRILKNSHNSNYSNNQK